MDNNNTKMEKKRVRFFLPEKKNNKVAPDRGEKKNINGNKKNFIKNKPNKSQQNHDKNRENLNSDVTESTKKPFDKKTYRLKKYSKKYKLDQWEEQRKKRLMRSYQKELKKDPLSGSYKPISFDDDDVDSVDGEEEEEVGKFVKHPDFVQTKPIKKDPYQKAKEQYKTVKEQKIEKQKEIERAKQEREKKLQEYKKKKQERFKKLSKKTKKGQPVMTGRLELLLEKIQNNK